MVDTHGLPMKFEFCWSHMYYEVDFNDCRDGNPKLTVLEDGTVEWGNKPERYATMIACGSWKITKVLEDIGKPVPVEDLL